MSRSAEKQVPSLEWNWNTKQAKQGERYEVLLYLPKDVWPAHVIREFASVDSAHRWMCFGGFDFIEVAGQRVMAFRDGAPMPEDAARAMEIVAA